MRFLGLDFITTKDTFIPRPETELLVRACLGVMEEGARVLDIGTGSGNIAIALTKADKLCKIVALDISEAALAVAKKNADRYGVAGRIEFIKSDLFYRGEFDVIVSNPPYVERWEIETLAEGVKEEPRIALDGGTDGLDFYKRIIAAAPGYLKDGGFLIMELGYNQAHKVRLLLEKAGFSGIRFYRDFAGIKRVVRARWINS